MKKIMMIGFIVAIVTSCAFGRGTPVNPPSDSTDAAQLATVQAATNVLNSAIISVLRTAVFQNKSGAVHIGGAGQSNMYGTSGDGLGNIAWTASGVSNAYLYDTVGSYSGILKPLGTTSHWGPEISGSIWLLSNGVSSIYFSKTSVGNTSIQRWDPDSSDLYSGITNATESMRQSYPDSGKLDAFWWVHGVFDCSQATNAIRYADSLQNIVNQIRVDENNPTLPIIIAEVAPILPYPYYQAIVDAMHDLADNEENIVVVSVAGLETAEYFNTPHYTAAGLIELGNRMAAATLEFVRPGNNKMDEFSAASKFRDSAKDLLSGVNDYGKVCAINFDDGIGADLTGNFNTGRDFKGAGGIVFYDDISGGVLKITNAPSAGFGGFFITNLASIVNSDFSLFFDHMPLYNTLTDVSDFPMMLRIGTTNSPSDGILLFSSWSGVGIPRYALTVTDLVKTDHNIYGSLPRKDYWSQVGITYTKSSNTFDLWINDRLVSSESYDPGGSAMFLSYSGFWLYSYETNKIPNSIFDNIEAWERVLSAKEISVRYKQTQLKNRR